MIKTANILRHLHRIHRQLADLNERIARGPRQLKARQAGVEQLEADLAAIQKKTIESRMAADRKQLQLQTGEAKILDLNAKLNACSSNREYQALVEQIAADTMANSVLEDEILEALERIEQLLSDVETAKQAVAKGLEELEQQRRRVAEATKQLEAEQAGARTELAQVEEELPSDFRTDYERVARVKGEDAMAAVEDDCCTGCCQRISPNMISNLTMAVVVQCNSCGRMLYLHEDD